MAGPVERTRCGHERLLNIFDLGGRAWRAVVNGERAIMRYQMFGLFG